MLTIVAVHGNGGGGDRFALLAPHLPADVTLHTPTLPGFGGRPLGGIDGIGGLAAALAAELASTPRPRVLLGHGIGGSVALQTLADDPSAADALILHAPVGTRLDTRWFPRIMARPAVRDRVQTTIADPRLRPLLRRVLLRDVPPDVADRFLAAYADAEAFGALFDWLTAAWFDALPALTLPSVVLWGERDRVLDADQRGDYDRVLPGARDVVVPRWGHFPMLDQPAGYARTIVELGRSLVAASTRP